MIKITKCASQQNLIFIKLKKQRIFFYNFREFFVVWVYNVYKEKTFTSEIEDGHEAPWKPSTIQYNTNQTLFVSNFIIFKDNAFEKLRWCSDWYKLYFLKGVFAKNERGYRLNALKKALLIATNLTSSCCVYKEKIVKND